ncbi:MAG: PhoH family protein [Thermoleophilia bacterium]|jgi:phosphate starvation-inducible PhoH-like protein|nr:PhoH family protein [Thermoleophilia bacterium]
MTERVIEVADRVAVELAGEHDAVLRALEERLRLDINLRGNRVVLTGEDVRVERGVAVIDELARLVDSGRTLAPTMIEAVAASIEHSGRPDALLGDVVWRHRQRSITPTTAGQKEYVDAIRRNTITFGIGPAGTGKTYLAVALATAALSRREVGRIILTRPAVEAGEKLGFLPGDVAAKVDPYLRPLFDAMHDMLDADRAQEYLERGQIEVAPLAFMRGRTLNDSFIILDEAQNTTVEQMKMFLTRLGFGSKVVVTGDITQVDLPRDRRSGLADIEKVLGGIPAIEVVHFSHEDVVRHKLVQHIVEAYRVHEESDNPWGGTR